MKLFALHSPAFEAIWLTFKQSVAKNTSFELVDNVIPSQFDNCYYGQKKYYELLKWLVEFRLKLVREERDVFATAGIDTLFFGDPVNDLTSRIIGKDLLGADDYPGQNCPPFHGHGKLCSCLYVIRPGQPIADLLSKVLHDDRLGHECDDPILNEFRDMVRWECLPNNLYHNPATWHEPKKCWYIGDPVPELPKDMLWFHANYCVGIATKIALLQAVKARRERADQCA